MILLLDFVLIKHVDVKQIEWNSFLPHSQSEDSKMELSNGNMQYLFCKLPSAQIAKDFEKSHKIEKYITLPNYKDTYILIFDITKLRPVLEMTKQYERSGTSMVGTILFENFFQELGYYAKMIFPFVLLILLFFIPLRLWLDILLEMAIYSVLLLSILSLNFFEINTASLLATVFLIIYALTLINYIYSDGMNIKRLFFGIQISVIATMLSALFLISSQFGLIHSFGVMLLVGLVVLHFYMNVRIYLMRYFQPDHYKHYFDSFFEKHRFSNKISSLLIGSFILIGIALLFTKTIGIDLNIINLLSKSSNQIKEIKSFEQNNLVSLPFVITLSLKQGYYTDPKNFALLAHFEQELTKIMPGKIIASEPQAFETFKELAPDKMHKDLYPQFLLANSFMHNSFNLLSSNMKQSNIVISIALDTPTKQMRDILKNIELLAQNYPNFDLQIQGKISDFDYYTSIFEKEFLVGFLFTLLATALFFWFFCKNPVSIVSVFLSALFSLGTLVLAHMGFDKPLSVVSLISVILYAGLITDSLIQLFVCYKGENEACETTVLQPIFISNISILIFLIGMFFVGGIMRAFAMDLALLLSVNLVFIIFIVPTIRRKYFKIYSA